MEVCELSDSLDYSFSGNLLNYKKTDRQLTKISKTMTKQNETFDK